MRKKLIFTLVTALLLQALFPVAFASSQNAEAGLRYIVCSSDTSPEGAGNGASTGRTTPNSLNEQLGMKQVQSDPLSGAKQVPIELKDTRWPATDGWVKMENVVRLPDENITIHFNYNTNTGAFADFKFK